MTPSLTPPAAPVSPLNLSRDVVGWERADRLVRELRHFDEGRIGVGSCPTPARVICSTVMLMRRLIEADFSPPDRVYALPDGNVMLEWLLEGRGMMRLEVEEEGRGQVMMTRPGTPVKFVDLEWRDVAWWKSKVWGDWKSSPTMTTNDPALPPPSVVANPYTMAA